MLSWRTNSRDTVTGISQPLATLKEKEIARNYLSRVLESRNEPVAFFLRASSALFSKISPMKQKQKRKSESDRLLAEIRFQLGLLGSRNN